MRSLWEEFDVHFKLILSSKLLTWIVSARQTKPWSSEIAKTLPMTPSDTIGVFVLSRSVHTHVVSICRRIFASFIRPSDALAYKDTILLSNIKFSTFVPLSLIPPNPPPHLPQFSFKSTTNVKSYHHLFYLKKICNILEKHSAHFAIFLFCQHFHFSLWLEIYAKKKKMLCAMTS